MESRVITQRIRLLADNKRVPRSNRVALAKSMGDGGIENMILIIMLVAADQFLIVVNKRVLIVRGKSRLVVTEGSLPLPG